MNKQLPAWLWVIIATVSVLAIGCLDWLTGIQLSFFVLYFLPVAAGSWFVGLGFSVALAVLSATVWFGISILLGQVYSHPFYAVWNFLIHLISFLAIGWSVYNMRYSFERERKEAEDLERALSEIKVLEAFLPICAQCKKIRDQQGAWKQLEVYIGQQTGTQFSHTYCPECARKVLANAGLTGKKKEP